MTRIIPPTAIQTTLGDLAGSLNEIYRTAGYREPYPRVEWRCGAACVVPTPGPDCPWCEATGLEGNTSTEADEPSVDPDLIPDRMKAIEAGHYDEYEPEGDE